MSNISATQVDRLRAEGCKESKSKRQILWWIVAIDKKNFLTEVKSLLEYHNAIGIRHYPRTGEIETFCGLQPSPPPAKSTRKPVKVQAAKENKFEKAILSDIDIEVAACRACDLHKHRIYPVAGGGTGGRLMVVGDWLSGDAEGSLAKDRIFGVDQDQMLARMLGAINLSPDVVFITNVIKCAVPSSCHPAAENVRCCMSFLRRQITLLAPEMICTMGMIAAKAVLDRPQSLSQLRGTFHEYEDESGINIPVLATYHPTYLLQNPEMKKATWDDLQLLAKKMNSSG